MMELLIIYIFTKAIIYQEFINMYIIALNKDEIQKDCAAILNFNIMVLI